MDASSQRTALTDLADQLRVEFAGSLPPGQILRTVYRAHLLALRTVGIGTDRLDLSESIARRLLHERIVAEIQAGTPPPRPGALPRGFSPLP